MRGARSISACSLPNTKNYYACMQLLAPDKVDIPDRLIEYEDVELSPEQEKLKQKKIRAIETMLSRSG